MEDLRKNGAKERQARDLEIYMAYKEKMEKGEDLSEIKVLESIGRKQTRRRKDGSIVQGLSLSTMYLCKKRGEEIYKRLQREGKI